MSTKITALSAITGPASTDVVPVVDLSGPTTKKVTIANLMKVIADHGSQDVVTTGVAKFGTTPATAGAVRIPNATNIMARNAANSGNFILAGSDASDNVVLGGYWDGSLAATSVFVSPTTFGYLRAGGSDYVRWGNGVTQLSLPVAGLASPYSIHGTVISAMTDADYSVPASEYIYSEIEVPAALTLMGTRKFKLPTPATEAASYNIEVSNLTTGAQSIQVTRADGDTTAAVTLLTTTRGMIRVRPSGCYLQSAALA